jgi:hypothetical protein
MTTSETMALLGSKVSLSARSVYVVFGLLAFFFPGYVYYVAIKYMGNVLRQLTIEERYLLADLLQSE